MSDAVDACRAWVEQVVVGLGLCPYARRPWTEGTVRFVLCDDPAVEERLTTLWLELERLVGSDPSEIATTLLVLPGAPSDFDGFLSETDLADDVVEHMGLVGEVQIVPFHPAFRFAGDAVDDPANGVNRSPVPMWHLLREEELEAVRLRDPGAGERIAEANRALLRATAGALLPDEGPSS